ncbi:1-acyl-sn-glycerol-3-phosphate acyltransferase [Candidatus Villigracilis saccharophilus]|uniref:1-acyl-sn-glycerol-3-phosphate acyltransferase n=1 Tax=Candidatus Villigracilis saccharophilus TaxID=3140684 RepID=UPI0031374CCA|nr:1-acyl-sn-glycerol-3-phosphate acyltransferase [Anaerolineales bacterium]
MALTTIHPNLYKLNNTLLNELAKAIGLPQTGSTRSLLHLLFGKATRRFAEVVLRFDDEVGRNGSAAGARWLLSHFVAGHEAQGMEIIPRDGPLLIVANHPASYDGLLISAYVNRSDYKIMIGEIPAYGYLPHVSQYAIFSPPAKNTFGRMQTVRNAVQHLKNGGALLIFPRGGIEPDPAFMPNPDAEFDKWSRSLEIFLHRVPLTRVLVTTVSGVIAPASMRHPITWFRGTRADRQRLAFIYQMIRQVLSDRELFGLTPRVTFGEVLSGANHQNVLLEVEQSARRVLQQHLSYAKS